MRYINDLLNLFNLLITAARGRGRGGPGGQAGPSKGGQGGGGKWQQGGPSAGRGRGGI